MDFQELYWAMDSCIRCGLCEQVCPVMRVRGFTSFPLLDTLFPAFGTRWDSYTLVDLLSQCTGCGACRGVCPQGIDIPSAIAWLREDASRKAGALLAVIGAEKNILLTGNLFGFPRPEASRSWAEVLYYPGCFARYRRPSLVEAWEKLMDGLGQKFTVLGSQEGCCGFWLFRWGRAEAAREVSRANAELIRSTGASVLVTGCPHCLYTLAWEYPRVGVDIGMPVLHTTEFLTQLAREGRIGFSSLADQKLVYHEPCYLKHYLGKEGLGNLFNLAGYKSVRADQGDVSECCGGGDGISLIRAEVARDLARQVVSRAEKAGAGTLVTACPNCLENFSLETVRLNVADILELVQV